MRFDSRLIGHLLPQRILYQAIVSQKVGHAYLFSGEEGIGKRALALAVAKTLLCPKKVPYCGECASCKRANQNTHPDLFEIFPDGNFIKLGQIKQIQEQMAFHPALGLKKVFVIDEADRLNPEAANAFLKSLEEPPSHTHFFLISSRPLAILSTIASRCQQIRFSIPARNELIQLLVESKNLSNQDAQYIAKRSQGRVGLAFSLEMETLESEDKAYFQLIHAAASMSPDRLFQFSEELSRDADHFKKTVGWILSFIRDIILWKNCPDPELLILDRHWEMIRRSSTVFSQSDLYRSFDFFQKVEKLIQRNINRSLALESGLLHLRIKPGNILLPKELN